MLARDSAGLGQKHLWSLIENLRTEVPQLSGSQSTKREKKRLFWVLSTSQILCRLASGDQAAGIPSHCSPPFPRPPEPDIEVFGGVVPTCTDLKLRSVCQFTRGLRTGLYRDLEFRTFNGLV
jgi:hypothetical protein